MREIKFRGISLIDHTPDDMPYCIFKGDMVTGLLAKAGENAWIIGSVVEATEDYIAIESWIPVDHETVGQYTGLQDKNGKEIYEGDIVEAWSQGIKGRGEIKQRNDGLWIFYPAWQSKRFWGLMPSLDGTADVEVIGNIHENPKLLEVLG